MPVNDWTRVEAGIFHDFHTVWTGALRTRLNEGILPEGYYALAEQHVGRSVADVLTLHSGPSFDPQLTSPPPAGGIATAEAPPRVRRWQTVESTALARRRTLAVRHVSGHRLVAILEVLSPANKDRAAHLQDFVTKAIAALDLGVHLLVVDLFPPAMYDPGGIHGAIGHAPCRVGPAVQPACRPAVDAGQLRGGPANRHLSRAPRGRRSVA